MRLLASLFSIAALAICTPSCRKAIDPFSVAHVDRNVGPSHHPLATDPGRVGSYPGSAKSGAGYFYDEVLEYRVWLHPERGAERLAASEDYFAAFARYESALEFSSNNAGAEAPLVLVRQRESVNEPTPGTFVWDKVERITEWQVKWLAGSHRGPNSIPDFLAAHTEGPKPSFNPRPARGPNPSLQRTRFARR